MSGVMISNTHTKLAVSTTTTESRLRGPAHASLELRPTSPCVTYYTQHKAQAPRSFQMIHPNRLISWKLMHQKTFLISRNMWKQFHPPFFVKKKQIEDIKNNFWCDSLEADYLLLEQISQVQNPMKTKDFISPKTVF